VFGHGRGTGRWGIVFGGRLAFGGYDGGAQGLPSGNRCLKIQRTAAAGIADKQRLFQRVAGALRPLRSGANLGDTSSTGGLGWTSSVTATSLGSGPRPGVLTTTFAANEPAPSP